MIIKAEGRCDLIHDFLFYRIGYCHVIGNCHAEGELGNCLACSFTNLFFCMFISVTSV